MGSIKKFFAKKISWIFRKEVRCIVVFKHWWTKQSYVTLSYFNNGIETDLVKFDTTLIFENKKKTRKELRNFAKEEAKKYEDWHEKIINSNKENN